MATDPAELARRTFDALARDGVDGMVEFVHPDFVMETPAGLAAEPQRYEGHAGVRLWFEQFYEVMDEVMVSAEEVEELEDGRVLVHLRLQARGQSSGIEAKQEAIAVATLKHDLVTRLDFYFTEEEARASAVQD
jgi:ketosteroid isomerase-like protein